MRVPDKSFGAGEAFSLFPAFLLLLLLSLLLFKRAWRVGSASLERALQVTDYEYKVDVERREIRQRAHNNGFLTL